MPVKRPVYGEITNMFFSTYSNYFALKSYINILKDFTYINIFKDFSGLIMSVFI